MRCILSESHQSIIEKHQLNRFAIAFNPWTFEHLQCISFCCLSVSNCLITIKSVYLTGKMGVLPVGLFSMDADSMDRNEGINERAISRNPIDINCSLDCDESRITKQQCLWRRCNTSMYEYNNIGFEWIRCRAVTGVAFWMKNVFTSSNAYINRCKLLFDHQDIPSWHRSIHSFIPPPIWLRGFWSVCARRGQLSISAYMCSYMKLNIGIFVVLCFLSSRADMPH